MGSCKLQKVKFLFIKWTKACTENDLNQAEKFYRNYFWQIVRFMMQNFGNDFEVLMQILTVTS